MTRRAALAALALLLAGCASLERPALRADDAASASCRQWFTALDEAVDRAGVRDAEVDPIDGFPGLRIDRLTAALARRANASDEAFAAWLQRLRLQDHGAREIEIANLPGSAAFTRGRLDTCSEQLAAAVQSEPQARRQLVARAQVPDRYSNASRVLGLYALTRVPFFAGVAAWQREHGQAMSEAAAQPRAAQRFVPDAPTPTAPNAASFARDALGLPRIDGAAAARLLAAHAPLFDIEQQGDFDRPGTPIWQADGRIAIDTARPVVYQRLAHTLVRGQALVQLVYTLWFAERPRRGAFDMLGGALDGVVVRITLGPDGKPLLLDTIHACGCYHLFFPAQGVALRPDAPKDEEWAFVPASLPAWAPDKRFVIRIASASHYVLGVSAATQAGDGASRYALRPEADLRSLPRPDGERRSLYKPDGLVAGSERAERFLFWPMGIASAGAMRQWGHHATAFVGRRHFDDADLIERRFAIPGLE